MDGPSGWHDHLQRRTVGGGEALATLMAVLGQLPSNVHTLQGHAVEPRVPHGQSLRRWQRDGTLYADTRRDPPQSAMKSYKASISRCVVSPVPSSSLRYLLFYFLLFQVVDRLRYPFLRPTLHFLSRPRCSISSSSFLPPSLLAEVRFLEFRPVEENWY